MKFLVDVNASGVLSTLLVEAVVIATKQKIRIRRKPSNDQVQ